MIKTRTIKITTGTSYDQNNIHIKEKEILLKNLGSYRKARYKKPIIYLLLMLFSTCFIVLSFLFLKKEMIKKFYEIQNKTECMNNDNIQSILNISKCIIIIIAALSILYSFLKILFHTKNIELENIAIEKQLEKTTLKQYFEQKKSIPQDLNAQFDKTNFYDSQCNIEYDIQKFDRYYNNFINYSNSTKYDKDIRLQSDNMKIEFEKMISKPWINNETRDNISNILEIKWHKSLYNYKNEDLLIKISQNQSTAREMHAILHPIIHEYKQYSNLIEYISHELLVCRKNNKQIFPSKQN